MGRIRRLVTVGAILATALSPACKRSSTSPSSGAPSGTPAILGTIPSQPSLSDLAQIIQVTGHDFQNGMIATMLRPDGRSLAFLASELRQLTSTSFQLSVVLDLAGDYQLEVKNLGGQVSAPFALSVRSAAQGTLTLNSVTPSTAIANSQPQGIVVSGSNFDSSLEAILTGPDSLMTFYPSPAMTGLNSTTFSLNVVLDKVGTYSLIVRNSSNSTSNPLTIDVRRTF